MSPVNHAFLLLGSHVFLSNTIQRLLQKVQYGHITSSCYLVDVILFYDSNQSVVANTEKKVDNNAVFVLLFCLVLSSWSYRLDETLAHMMIWLRQH